MNESMEHVAVEQIDLGESFPNITLGPITRSEDADGGFLFASISDTEDLSTSLGSVRFSLDTDHWSVETSPVVSVEAIDAFKGKHGADILAQIEAYLNERYPDGPAR